MAPLVIWPSLLAFVSNRRPVITPPLFYTPSLSHTPAAGLLCTTLITEGTLDTTLPYKSTPGHILKGEQITSGGVLSSVFVYR